MISFLKCSRGRGSNSSWIVFQILKKSFLTASIYKTYRSQKWLQCLLVSDSASGLTAGRHCTRGPGRHRTSSGSAAGETFCRRRWWCDSEHTRAWCSRHTGQRGCDTEERYLGKSKEWIRKLKTDRSGHLFPKHHICKDQQFSHSKRIQVIFAKYNLNHAQSGSFKHNNKKLWLPRNMDYSAWQTR